jgi:glycine cleavage system H protein
MSDARSPGPEESLELPEPRHLPPDRCLTFMMGKFEAQFPLDRLYAKNHMWAQPIEPGTEAPSPNPESRIPNPESPAPSPQPPVPVYRFGFSAYAVRLLQDVYFLDWHLSAPAKLAEKQEIGEIESSKAESALFAPMPGVLTEINADLLADPSTINVDNYGRGWLFEIAGDGQELLSPEEYMVHLEAAWKLAERTIKGQMNE